MISSPYGHDWTWERELIDRIRRDGVIPEVVSLVDLIPSDYKYVNATTWEAAEEHSKDAIRTNAAYLDDASIARRRAERELRQQNWAESRAEWRAYEAGLRPKPSTTPDIDPAEIAARKNRAALKKLVEEERAARDAELRAAAAERVALWEKENKRRGEESRVLASKWICTVCNGKSMIEKRNDGYQLTCLNCGKQAWGSHGALMGVLNR
jgi:hypothetical protein